MICLLESVNGSKQHLSLPLTLKTPLDTLDHLAQVEEQRAWQPRLVREPSLVLSPTQN